MSNPFLRPLMLAAASLVLAPTLVAGEASAHEQATVSVTIANVATGTTLKLPDGSTTGAPIAPGAYAVVADGAHLFEAGMPASGEALESLAEDGNAEPLIARLKSMAGVREAGLFIPGQPFEVTARPGDRLVFASMFVQSNDIFLAPAPEGIPLFDAAERPIAGDLTRSVMLWDAGTEVNEAPGAGPNQAPRQAKANSGPAENGMVHALDDGFAYPPVGEVVQVTLRAE
jgi:hypothetical protein